MSRANINSQITTGYKALFAIFVLLLPAIGFSCGEVSNHTVLIKNLKFDPPVLNVCVGDKVRWVNQDFIPHTVTADDKSWDSELIELEKYWEIVVDKNTFSNYFCQYHPGMRGELTIKP